VLFARLSPPPDNRSSYCTVAPYTIKIVFELGEVSVLPNYWNSFHAVRVTAASTIRCVACFVPAIWVCNDRNLILLAPTPALAAVLHASATPQRASQALAAAAPLPALAATPIQTVQNPLDSSEGEM
jgi:hypothetical protein